MSLFIFVVSTVRSWAAAGMGKEDSGLWRVRTESCGEWAALTAAGGTGAGWGARYLLMLLGRIPPRSITSSSLIWSHCWHQEPAWLPGAGKRHSKVNVCSVTAALRGLLPSPTACFADVYAPGLISFLMTDSQLPSELAVVRNRLGLGWPKVTCFSRGKLPKNAFMLKWTWSESWS